MQNWLFKRFCSWFNSDRLRNTIPKNSPNNRLGQNLLKFRFEIKVKLFDQKRHNGYEL